MSGFSHCLVAIGVTATNPGTTLPAQEEKKLDQFVEEEDDDDEDADGSAELSNETSNEGFQHHIDGGLFKTRH